jgi:formylglycine-generating enzyme required for sulfatase activity
MRKLLIALLLLNAVCLLAIYQPLSVLAGSGSGGGPVDACEGDPTKYALDTNGDKVVDLSDFVTGLSWFFSGGEAPRICLDTTGLEASLAQAEEDRDTFEMYLEMCAEDFVLLESILFDCAADVGLLQDLLGGCAEEVELLEADLVEVEGERDTAQAALVAAETDLALPAPPSGFTFVERNAQGYDEYTHDSSGIRFVRLPGRSFEMGSPEGETGRIDPYEAVHTVWLTPFLIAKYEVKQSEYEGVMTGNTAGLDATPSTATGANLPVEQVSWDHLRNADGFLARTGLSLPSEAQWEYACRAGTSGPYAGNGVLDDMGWYDSNSGNTSHDVGGKQANQFGLHDMHGNIYEWCEDVFKGNFYADDVPGFDPVSTTDTGYRVVRGGSFNRNARAARSAYRSQDGSDFDFFPSVRFNFLGFRPVRPLP